MKHPCPYCGRDCMSSQQKLFLNPTASIPCRSCGGSVSVTWRHYFWTVLALLAALITLRSLQFEGLPLVLLGMLAAGVILLLHIWLVPLSRYDAN